MSARLNEWSAYRMDSCLEWETYWSYDNMKLIQATVKGAGLSSELLATRIRLTRSVPQELQDFLAVLATKGYREWRNSGPATSFDNRSFTWTGPGPDFEFTCERSEWTVDVGRKPSREILQKHGIQSPADAGLGLRR